MKLNKRGILLMGINRQAGLGYFQIPDELFVKFLEECVHPLVSTSIDEPLASSRFSGYLVHDGFAPAP
jgi:hypothetical protein